MGEHADELIERMLEPYGDDCWYDKGDSWWYPLPPGIRAPELKPASPEDFPLV